MQSLEKPESALPAESRPTPKVLPDRVMDNVYIAGNALVTVAIAIALIVLVHQVVGLVFIVGMGMMLWSKDEVR